MSLLALKTLLASYGLSPCKAKGQHFLFHQDVLKHVQPYLVSDQVLEIGPGPGTMTQWLKQSASLVLMEKDARFERLLKMLFPEATLIIGDALNCPWPLGHKIVGNLPYNVSVLLLMKYLAHTSLFKGALFMFQKEVAQRITARPGSKEYGRLSVMAQLYSRPVWVMDVSSAAFWPRPQVDSSFIHFLAPLSPCLVPFSKMERLVAQAFQNRRKMLHHNVKGLDAHQWKACAIDPQRRAETLSIEEFHRLALILDHVDTP